MPRKLVLLLAALLLSLVIADTVVWFWTVRQIRAGWDQWAAAERDAGWAVAAGRPEAGGWPLAAAITLPDVSLRGGQAAIPGGVAWDAQRLVLRLSARHPQVLRIEAGGRQHLRVSHGPDIAYSARRLFATVRLRDPQAPAALHGQALRIGLAGGAGSPLMLGRVSGTVAFGSGRRGVPAAVLALDARQVGLPNGVTWALGDRMAWLRLTVALNGPLPAAPDPTAAAAAWRDAGGTVVVRRLALAWGPLGLSATGSLHLDAQLQPAGRAEARVTGYAATLDALARRHVMSKTAAVAATALLSLLAVTPADGGPPAVDVPLTLHAQVLSLQQIPLLRIPALDWPAP